MVQAGGLKITLLRKNGFNGANKNNTGFQKYMRQKTEPYSTE